MKLAIAMIHAAKSIIALSLMGLLAHPSNTVGGDLDQNLVVHWTFDNGSLESRIGHFMLSPGGTGELQAKDGELTLREHKFVMEPQISSSQFPDLTGAVTIWARLRFDEFPAEREANILSLQSIASGGTWDSITFAVVYRSADEEIPTPGLSFLARTASGAELGVGPEQFMPVKAGQFVNVALVFDGEARTARLWLNGSSVRSSLPDATKLAGFAAFGAGVLSTISSSCTVTFDEVRIYSTALDDTWIEEIAPAADR